MKELYVVYFESANYAGYGEWVLVWAHDEDEARDNSDMLDYAENFYYEQDADEYLEDNEDEDFEGPWANVVSVEPLRGSDSEEIYKNYIPGSEEYVVFGTPE